MTTLLASGWGLVSAYILFTTLLSPHHVNVKFMTVMAALLPLIAVWATVERKRWGRLALIGLSAGVIGIFVTATINYAVMKANAPQFDGGIPDTFRRLPFFDTPFTLGVLLVFAVSNLLWLRSPRVVAEFNHNKRPALALAQRGIATSLVVCWGVVIIGSACLSQSSIDVCASPQPNTLAVRPKSRFHPKFTEVKSSL